MNFLFISITLTYINSVLGSAGNESPFFIQCLTKCSLANCTHDGLQFLKKDTQSVHLRLLRWTCEDECGYSCMWKTVEGFRVRNYRVPQFYGKWPFIRVLGMQEPASTVFSLLNLHANVKMLKALYTDVRSGAPLIWLWYIYGLVVCHGWVWSAIFHTRDLHFTEFMDYSCAFSMVLIACYAATIRLLRNTHPFALIFLTVFFLTFFLNHVAYLYMGGFDYGYNMKVNLTIGGFTVMCWLGWSVWNRKRKPYVWKMALYVTLMCITTLLEIVDVPPIFWIFDFHSLWHLSTVPLVYLFYSFIIEDCKHLRKQKYDEEKLSLSK